MKREKLFNLSVAFGLALALGVGVVMARRAQAQEGVPEGTLSSQAAVGTGFTYQGRVLDNGTPVEGTCDFGLSLYGSPSGVDQIGTTQDKTGVPVSNGYFTVNDLDFGADAFDGSARYLEIAVDCGSGAETLDPRVALNPAPYAHSLRPGADIVGDIDVGSVVCADNSGSGYGLTGWSAGGHGVRGRSDSASGYGVYGHGPNGTGVYGKGSVTGTVGIATGSSGVARGVYGESASPLGTGVKGKASATTGVTFGVVGESESPDGAGVAGYADSTTGTNYGVWGIAFSSEGYGARGIGGSESGLLPGVVFRKGAGVWGDSKDSPGVYGTSDSDNAVEGLSNTGNGVSGISTSGVGIGGFSISGSGASGASGSGIGVEGVSSSGTGVRGESSGSTGIPYGVYGIASDAGSATSYGVYGESNSSSGTGVGGEAPMNGVYGKATDSAGYGVYGEATSLDTLTGVESYGGYFVAKGAFDIGVYGESSYEHAFWPSYGGYFKTASGDGAGVYGEATHDQGGRGVHGKSKSDYGVYGESDDGAGVAGTGAIGVYGETSQLSAGGMFKNTYQVSEEDAVGVWAGSFYGDIIQGWELYGNGDPDDRRFRVAYNGQVYADGAFNSGGADFAEMLPGADDLEPGDVLVIGADGELARSTEANASAVVGVYSTKPALVGGSDESMENPGKVPLAIVGIAPVKASAENGVIAPGDLLVASTTPGHAMKAGSSPSIGTVIGKALEGLDSGTGFIQMLVMLQ